MPSLPPPQSASASETAQWAAVVALFALTLPLLSSLAGCEGCGPKHLRRFGATCGRNSECTGGVCYQGRCTRSCKDSAECGAGICIESVCHEPESDMDGDGLSNAYEALWKLDPSNPDSDGDGKADGAEIGPNPDVPDDKNGDGLIDARQSSLADSDGDCMVDEVDLDPSSAVGAKLPSPLQLCDQGVCAAALPAVKVVCRPEAAQQNGVAFGCLGCGCSADPAQVPNWQAAETSCDGLDNDCDGLTDEEQLWLDLPIGATCQVFDGVCGEPDESGLAPVGVVECLANKSVGCSVQSGGSASPAGPETCNLTDDNCNGVKDEGFSFNGIPVGGSCTGCGETTFNCNDGSPANPPIVSCSLSGDAALCGALPMADGFERVTHGLPEPRPHWSAAWAAGWQRLLVYGGAVPTANMAVVRADLWSVQPGQGWQRMSAQAPGARHRAALVWDAVGDRVLLVGGSQGGAPALKVWALSKDLTWTDVSDINIAAGSHIPGLPFAVGGKVTRAAIIGDAKIRRLVVLPEGLNAIWSVRIDASGKALWQATSTTAIGSPEVQKLTGNARCLAVDPALGDHAMVLMPGGTALKAGLYRLTLDATKALVVVQVQGAAPPDRRHDQCVLDGKGKLHVFGGEVAGGATSASWHVGTFPAGSSAAGAPSWQEQTVADHLEPAMGRSGAFVAWHAATDDAVIAGGYRLMTSGAGARRRGLVDAVRWQVATGQAPDLTPRQPRGRIGAASGRRKDGSLCVGGGLLLDLPDVDGQASRVYPARDLWCGDEQGTWKLVTDSLPAYAFGMGTVDTEGDRMVLAGGYALSSNVDVPEVWRLWQTGLTFDEAKPLPSQPKVTDAVHVVNLATGAIKAMGVGPRLAAAASVHDAVRRRLITFGGFDDVRPTRSFWRLDLKDLKWTDLGGELGPMKAQYGSILVYDALADVLGIAGGIQHNVVADAKDPIVRQIPDTKDGSTKVISQCLGLQHTVMYLTRAKAPANFKVIKLPTWADPEAAVPKEKLFRPHFGQPSFLPTLFDPIGRRGLIVLPDVNPAKSKDDEGNPCPGFGPTPWTSATVQIRVATGLCSGQPEVFIESADLAPIPTSLFMSAAVYDDPARRTWVWGGLEADGSASGALWRLDQACKGGTP